METEPLDVWLRFDYSNLDEYGDPVCEAEANTFREDDGYRVDWYSTAVGLVASIHFETYNDAV